MATLNRDFLDILSAFTDAKVEYLLVGAHALAAHGLVRGTTDIDLWVHSTPENARRVHEALVRFGAPAEQFAVDDFTRKGSVVQFGVPPVRIDVMTEISGVDWDDAWQHRLVADFEGIAVPVLGRAQMIANKRATKRPKDQLDVEWMEKERA